MRFIYIWNTFNLDFWYYNNNRKLDSNVEHIIKKNNMSRRFRAD